ncbi:MAG: hypothetical protein RBT49_06415 [Bacteroidales bacterium]|nr:hypothetical protein [Bacteroidales bacterium]
MKRDFRKIIKVVDSCKTKQQITVALKMVRNFADFYREEESVIKMFDVSMRVDELWKYALEKEVD